MVDENTLSTWWDTFKAPNQLTEVRILGPGKTTYSGYFTDKGTMISEIKRCQTLGGIYATINEINPACYGREQYNKIIKYPKSTTNDDEIVRRRVLLLDFDPDRPSDTNATDAELARAEVKMRETYKYLQDLGFPRPVVAMSGNGYHLSYKIDLPNDNETKTLLESFLKSLNMTLGGGGVKIDTTVYNASRIAKITGTTSNKGANTPERPQRQSYFVHIPDDREIVSVDLIKRVADEYPEPEKPTRQYTSSERFDIDGFLSRHGIAVARRERFNGGEKIILEECPFNPNHKDAAVFVFDGGGAAFKCFHQSCSSYGWREFVTHFEPGYYDNRPQPANAPAPAREYRSRQEPKPVEEDDRGKKWLDPTDVEYVDPRDLVFIKTGISEVDDATYGLLVPGFSVLTGKAGAGKSTILNHLILSARQGGYKTALWTGELPAWLTMSWLDQMAAGPNYVKPSDKKENNYYAPRHTCKKINEWLKGYFFLYNNDYGDRWSQLLADMRECIRKKGVNLLLIDNLMATTLDIYEGDKNEKQSQFAKGLKVLSREENVHIVLVAHPRKEIGMQLIRMDSVSGSADLFNACDNLYLLHRGGMDFDKRGREFFGPEKAAALNGFDLVLEIAKNRIYGKIDKLIGLYYDAKSRRIKNTIDELTVYGWEDNPRQESFLDDLPPDDLPSTRYYDNF